MPVSLTGPCSILMVCPGAVDAAASISFSRSSLLMPPFSAITMMDWVLGALPALISTVLTPASFLSDELTLFLHPAQVTPVKVASYLTSAP